MCHRNLLQIPNMFTRRRKNLTRRHRKHHYMGFKIGIKGTQALNKTHLYQEFRISDNSTLHHCFHAFCRIYYYVLKTVKHTVYSLRLHCLTRI